MMPESNAQSEIHKQETPPNGEDQHSRIVSRNDGELLPAQAEKIYTLCPFCGAHNPINANDCQKCGRDLRDAHIVLEKPKTKRTEHQDSIFVQTYTKIWTVVHSVLQYAASCAFTGLLMLLVAAIINFFWIAMQSNDSIALRETLNNLVTPISVMLMGLWIGWGVIWGVIAGLSELSE